MTEAGVPEEQAAQAAMWDACGASPLEFAGNLFMIKGIMGAKGWRSFVAGLATSMGSEGLTEFAQQYPDEAAMAGAPIPILCRSGCSTSSRLAGQYGTHFIPGSWHGIMINQINLEYNLSGKFSQNSATVSLHCFLYRGSF